MKKHFYILALSLLSTMCLNAQVATKVQIGDNQTYGITYSLPSSEVHLSVKATCTRTKAGIFAPYAEKFLAISDARQEDSEEWEVANITMTTKAVPDSSRTFHISCPEKSYLPSFYLTEGGMLWSVNREPERTAASVSSGKESVSSEAESADKLQSVNVLNEEFLKAGSKAKQAEIAARQIYRIRESRMDLLTGDVDNLPADEGSYRLVLANLDSQEKAYLELFTGVTTTETVEKEFVYVPKEEDTDILFRFSTRFGFVDADDLTGEPYSIKVSVLEDNRNVPVLLNVKAKVHNGLAYCVPGKASVSLLQGLDCLISGEYSMGQFGHVEFLPSSQFTDKKRPCSAQFNPQTGSIQIFLQNNQ